MENINFEGVNLAELLPRIPDSVKNGLPFGIVKMDLIGTILEYNMAEGELTGINPKWAIGKNFFDDVALCTKTQAFYGRFLEGVKKGFLNVVFEYIFDHQQVATKVKIHMFTMPDSKGKKTVMLLVKRAHQPVVVDAVAEQSIAALKAPSVQTAVEAVMVAMNQTLAEPLTPPGLRQPPESPQPKGSSHEDIIKF